MSVGETAQRGGPAGDFGPRVDGLAEAPAPFSAAGLLARRERLIALGSPVATAAPRHGDHRLNPDWPAPTALRDAAVLIAAVDRGSEATVILTQRTAHLAAHAGQVALPGGKIDPADADAVDAALREAEEEIGLARAQVRPLGLGDPYVTNSGYRIFPVVALVVGEPAVRANPHEVADLFEVPLGFLMSAANHREASREWKGAQRRYYEMPFGARMIWGVTAGILRDLSERVYGS